MMSHVPQLRFESTLRARGRAPHCKSGSARRVPLATKLPILWIKAWSFFVPTSLLAMRWPGIFFRKGLAVATDREADTPLDVFRDFVKIIPMWPYHSSQVPGWPVWYGPRWFCGSDGWNGSRVVPLFFAHGLWTLIGFSKNWNLFHMFMEYSMGSFHGIRDIPYGIGIWLPMSSRAIPNHPQLVMEVSPTMARGWYNMKLNYHGGWSSNWDLMFPLKLRSELFLVFFG